MTKKTVVFDFDGVIHSYKSGWQGAGVIPDPVVPGISDAIDDLRIDGYRVVVVSTRCSSPEGLMAVTDYLAQNKIIVDDVLAEKPPAICYIDDRAIRFDGDASFIVDQVKSFHSWTEGVPSLPPKVMESIGNLKALAAALRMEPGEAHSPRAMRKLRPCRATRYYKGESYEVKGWFHGWAVDYEEFEAGPGNHTYAIIEQEDGSIVTCPPGTVQFLDGGLPHYTEITFERGESHG